MKSDVLSITLDFQTGWLHVRDPLVALHSGERMDWRALTVVGEPYTAKHEHEVVLPLTQRIVTFEDGCAVELRLYRTEEIEVELG